MNSVQVSSFPRRTAASTPKEVMAQCNHKITTNDANKPRKPVPFPLKLHELLDSADVEGFASTVSWLADRKSFRVHDVDDFIDRIMPRYFNQQTRFKSFQRLINIWGFQRVVEGPGKGGYTHSSFVRGKPELCKFMKRTKVKGLRKRRPNKNCRTLSESSPPPLLEEKHEENLNHKFEQASWSNVKPVAAQKQTSRFGSTINPRTPTSFFASTSLSNKLFVQPDNDTSSSSFRNILSVLGKMNNGTSIGTLDSTPRRDCCLQHVSDQEDEPQQLPTSERISMFQDGDVVSFAGRRFHFVEDYRAHHIMANQQ